MIINIIFMIKIFLKCFERELRDMSYYIQNNKALYSLYRSVYMCIDK